MDIFCNPGPNQNQSAEWKSKQNQDGFNAAGKTDETSVIVREGGPFRKTCRGACGQIVTPLHISNASMDRSGSASVGVLMLLTKDLVTDTIRCPVIVVHVLYV